MKLGILLAFQNLQEVDFNIQKGGLHWLNRSQSFDFAIAIAFLFYIRF